MSERPEVAVRKDDENERDMVDVREFRTSPSDDVPFEVPRD